jgi:hypothetical protein
MQAYFGSYSTVAYKPSAPPKSVLSEHQHFLELSEILQTRSQLLQHYLASVKHILIVSLGNYENTDLFETYALDRKRFHT